MNILALQGSPRKNGNTVVLEDSFLKGLLTNKGNEVKKFFLNELNLKPCVACEACKTLTDRHCIIQDDGNSLYEEFLNSDVIVFSTPIYWWSITTQLKVFLDRLYALNGANKASGFRGKHIVLILTYGGEDPNSGAELVINMFEEISEYTGWTIDKVISYCSKDLHVSESSEKLQEAYDEGKNYTISKDS